MRRPGTVLALTAAGLLTLAGCAGDSVLELRVGDCLDSAELTSTQVTSVTALDCAVEHDGEIYAERTFDGEDYPGTDEVRQESDAFCRESFATFVGLPYDESELHYSTLYPTQDSWDTAEDRSSLCILLSEEPVTGSLADSAR